MVGSIVPVVWASSGFRVRFGLRRHGRVRPQVGIPRSYGWVIKRVSRLIFGVDSVVEYFWRVQGHEAVSLESADVEMGHSLALHRKFLPGLDGGADGISELIVSELGPTRARRIFARSVRLHWQHLLYHAILAIVMYVSRAELLKEKVAPVSLVNFN